MPYACCCSVVAVNKHFFFNFHWLSWIMHLLIPHLFFFLMYESISLAWQEFKHIFSFLHFAVWWSFRCLWNFSVSTERIYLRADAAYREIIRGHAQDSDYGVHVLSPFENSSPAVFKEWEINTPISKWHWTHLPSLVVSDDLCPF